MRVVYIYGPPGVGKLTVAEALVAGTDFKLLHNHLTVNLVRSLFQINSEPYLKLLRQFRRDMLSAAARENVDVIITGVYVGTDDQLMAIRQMLEPVYASSGTVLFVHVTCATEVWLDRVGSEARRAYDKLTDAERAVGLFDGRDPFAAMPFEPTLHLDITHLAPREAAACILDASNGLKADSR